MIVLRSLDTVLRKLMETVLVVSLAALSLSVLVQIGLRELFSVTYLPLEDIIPYSFSLSTFAGTALLFGEGGHIAITIFSDIMPAAPKKAVVAFAGLVTVLFILFLLRYGVDFMLDGSYQYSPLLNIRLCYVYAIVPLCALSSLVFMLAGRGRRDADNHQ